MANREKALKRRRTRLTKAQNPQATDLRRMRKLQRTRTEFWASKKTGKMERPKREGKKEAKERKAEKEPELEVIEDNESSDDGIDDLYSYDEDIEE